MNLKKNNKWHDEAVKMFQFNFELNNGKKNCKVDYALLNDEGLMLCYGFDLHDENLNEKDIFEFLLKDESINGDSSLMIKMFDFYDYGDNPLVFLATTNKIFFMPSGIRQINPFHWESFENPKLLQEKLLPR